jgi:hypothetical protein
MKRNMMKKIIILLSALLFYSTAVFAQGTSLSIGTKQANVGDTVLVPINGTALNNVGSISLKINYDSSALTFLGVSNSQVTFTSNTVNNQVVIGWFDATASDPLNISNGKIVDMKFIVTAVGALTFSAENCELLDESGSVISPIAYNNGSVGIFSTNLSMPNIKAVSGASVSVPIIVQKYKVVGSISLKINYDTTLLTFKNVTTTNGETFTANATNGVISIGWYDANGNTPVTLPDSSHLLSMNFTYNGGIASLSFSTSQCELLNSSGNVITGITYQNGGVNPIGGVPTISVDSIKAEKGSTVIVPVKVLAFNNIGSFSLKISYNAAALTYTGISGSHNGISITNNASSGILTLGWFDQAGNTPISIPNGVLANLNFSYAGGSSSLSFNTSLCEILDSEGNILSGIIYQDGSISIATGIKGNLSVVPNAYNLYQNFPNPFNPSTVIRYDLPKEGFVILKVYNIIGKEVCTLVNGVKQAGNHFVTFDASNLPSGLYIYSIKTKDFSSVRKLMLLK